MFVDIHHHLVYRVDDGAQSFEATQRLLRESYEDGVRDIVTTPHVTPGEVEFPKEKYLRRLQRVRDWCASEGMEIRLYTGAELLYTQYTPRLLQEGQAATLAGSRFALLEFLPTEEYEQLKKAARKVGSRGFMPVFAHVERYRCLKHASQFEELREHLGVRMQVNARTIVRRQGFLRDRFIASLIRDGMIDYIASDSHDMDGRHTCMTACYERLCDRFGEETGRALMCENPMEILRQSV